MILTAVWFICLKKCTIKKVTKKLIDSGENTYCPKSENSPFILCPTCNKVLKAKNKIINEQLGKTTYYCDNCKFKYECPVKLNIAY
jgi:hypothetical protein